MQRIKAELGGQRSESVFSNISAAVMVAADGGSTAGRERIAAVLSEMLERHDKCACAAILSILTVHFAPKA